MILLNPDLDLKAISEEFQDTGSVFIKDYLNPQLAEKLYQCLEEGLDWSLYTTEGKEDYSAKELAALSPEAQAALIAKLPNRYTADFRISHSRFQIKKSLSEGITVPPVLLEVLESIESTEYIDLMKRITNDSTAKWVSSNVSWYEPGHFVTAHSDGTPDDSRVAAHILSLTKNWDKNWGGILNFCDNWGRVVSEKTPSFNTLGLFKVPKRHFVSVVNEEAKSARYALYGWVHRKTQAEI